MKRLIVPLVLCVAAASSHAAPEPGRLFYSPAQRAQLEQLRLVPAGRHAAARAEPAYVPPLRFDGVVVRSDGRTTRWVNGRAQVGSNGTGGLKPGQVRADGKVYEPYQILPSPGGEIAP